MPNEIKPCPVCSDPSATLCAIKQSGKHRHVLWVNCPNCGEFHIDWLLATGRKSLIQNEMSWKFSAWIRQNKPEYVDAELIEKITESKIPSLHQRAMQLLSNVIKICGEGYNFNSNQIFRYNENAGFEKYTDICTISWCKNQHELQYLINEYLANELQLIKRVNNFYTITPKGLLQLEGIEGNSHSTIGFCAMWFNDEVLSLWTDAISPAINNAGYEPLRIDGKEHNDKIDDEIMASIRSSKFVVADITGNRGGVYYEAGFAHGLGLPVIFMCREGEQLHFDIRQYNTIFWNSGNLEDAKNRLTRRIQATLGQGPLKEFETP